MPSRILFAPIFLPAAQMPLRAMNCRISVANVAKRPRLIRTETASNTACQFRSPSLHRLMPVLFCHTARRLDRQVSTAQRPSLCDRKHGCPARAKRRVNMSKVRAERLVLIIDNDPVLSERLRAVLANYHFKFSYLPTEMIFCRGRSSFPS